MRHTALAAAALAALATVPMTAPATAGGVCDPNYRIECVPVAGGYAPAGYRTQVVAIPRDSHRPVVTGDPFIGGSGYVRDVPAYPLAVQAPNALRPVPYVYGYVTRPGQLPQDPPPEYVTVRVPVRHGATYGHAPVGAGLK